MWRRTFLSGGNSYNWSESLITHLRFRSPVPLPPIIRHNNFISSWRYDLMCVAFQQYRAWEHALSISQEFADSFSRSAVTTEDYLEAVQRLLDWEAEWRKQHNIPVDHEVLC